MIGGGGGPLNTGCGNCCLSTLGEMGEMVGVLIIELVMLVRLVRLAAPGDRIGLTGAPVGVAGDFMWCEGIGGGGGCD